MPADVVLETDLAGLRRINRGKVRDLYELDDALLIVATDRISAFDSILPTGIPHKGAVLTNLTLFWLDFLKDTVANHLITADVDRMGPKVRPYADLLRGRAMLVKKADVFPIECVVRGYLAGSGWKSYCVSGAVCGVRLPAGLSESEKLPEPIFTPASKAASGHDENISFEQAARIVGRETAEKLRRGSLAVYRKAADYARARGIVICDTKFEWGRADGRILLVDEVLTPDSSRFWPAAGYQPGRAQPSFDKQYVRDRLLSAGWNREPPAPPLPEEVVRRTSEKYLQAYEILTGKPLATGD
ncbi:MAG: phosphoribosylaminoimidazolesuccinocarboxamide synthase [Candidatus Brocadiia bacterium]